MNTEGGKLLQLFLITSLVYYHYGRSLISDTKFDKICVRLLELWDTFEHQHKHLITEGDLEAGTAYHLKFDDYPMMVKQAAMIGVIKLDEKFTV